MVRTPRNRMVARTSATDKLMLCRSDPSIARHGPLTAKDLGYKNPTLGTVLDYKNRQVVLRIRKEVMERGRELSTAESEALFQKTLKFLWGTHNGGKLVPTPDEDEGWHAFILYTKDYMKFCDRFFGHYLHHCPFPIGSKSDCKGPGGCNSACNKGCNAGAGQGCYSP